MPAAACRRALGCALLAAGVACDTSVTNPGSVDDRLLDDATAHQAIVNGASRTLARALGFVAMVGAGVSREIGPAIYAAVWGLTAKQAAGILEPALNEANDQWQYSQQARWVAEDGVRRLRAALGGQFQASEHAGQALLHVGYANRLLGENMCVAVIDGGPALPRTTYLARAEAAFGEAITVATAANDAATAVAARAGRASVRAWLGNWSGVVEDAAGVPLSFSYSVRYSGTELDQHNRIYWTGARQPYLNLTVAGTFYDDYFRTAQDPRTSWRTVPGVPTTVLGSPLLVQTKYDRRDAPANLSSGREMRLFVAEAMLRSGDWEAALGEINALRAATGVMPWSASDVVGTWTVLRRERGIELWLEGRRLGDLYRWAQEGIPGQAEDMNGRHQCFPIGQTELSANPNL